MKAFITVTYKHVITIIVILLFFKTQVNYYHLCECLS